MRYYGYHLARATFFAGQGAAGVIAYQASASSAPYRGDPATTEPSKGPPRSPAFELPTLVDTMGALFAEAVATYEQDFGEVQKGTFPLPWDMVDGVRNRQTSPLFLADQARRYVNEAISILTKRNRRDPGDFGVPYGGNADLYPDYYLNNFHFQTDGWLSSDSRASHGTSTGTWSSGGRTRCSGSRCTRCCPEPPQGQSRCSRSRRDRSLEYGVRLSAHGRFRCDLSSFFGGRRHTRWEAFRRRRAGRAAGTASSLRPTRKAAPCRRVL